MSSHVPNSPFLRAVLLGDAAAAGATGLLLAAGAGPLSALLELPQPLLLAAGLVLLPWAALLAWLGAKPALPAASVWAVIGINLLWVIESAALLLLGWVQPNMLGTAFVIAQAVVVVIFAELQFLALRRARQGGLASA